MEQISEQLLGFSPGPQRFSYTWRDAALYAMAVGATAADSRYLYEKDLHILPGFGVVPYFGSFGWEPPRATPQPAPMCLGLDPLRSLHMAHQLILHQPLEPYGGSFAMEDKISGLYDHRGKGVVIRSEMTARDQAGRPLFTNIGDVLFRGYQCAGAPPYVRAAVTIPDTPPELVIRQRLSPEQHLWYRLCGDTNVGHVDDALMRSRGRRGAIMQGMCSFGVACRLAVAELLPGAEQRVRRLGVEMRNVVYPGAAVELRLWRSGPRSACFRLVNLDDDNLALERAYLEWE